MTAFVGVDLAWGLTSPTGLAVLTGEGRLVASGTVRTDDDVAAFLEPVLGPDLVVAIDAPLVVPNETGARRCELELGAVYGRYDAGAHPSNRSRPYFNPPRGAELCARFGWDPDPSADPLRGRATAIEVYPHPAMVSLFRLARVLPYKAKPGRDLESLRAAFRLLLAHLERVAGPVLRLEGSPRWQHILDSVEAAQRKSDLRKVEDEVDAILCAYLAWLWAHDREQMQVFGGAEQGYIVVPRRDLASPARGARTVGSSRSEAELRALTGLSAAVAGAAPDLPAGDVLRIVAAVERWIIAQQ